MRFRPHHKGKVCVWPIAVAVVLAGACRSQERAPASRESGSTSESTDSLVLSSLDGVEVWFMSGRMARGADGRQCMERGLEIRRGGTRVTVPLLYTAVAPVLVDDTTMRAQLWTHCRPIDSYLVDLRSGQPIRERGGNGP
jgi:hypothetical protein